MIAIEAGPFLKRTGGVDGDGNGEVAGKTRRNRTNETDRHRKVPLEWQ